MPDSPDAFVIAYRRDGADKEPHRVPANRLTHPRLRKFWVANPPNKKTPAGSSAGAENTPDSGDTTQKES